MAFADNATAAVAVLGIVLGAATFLATFMISSTFAFTVSQRRRDLALLRLVGGSRRQVRRLLVGEAVLLGALGAGIGIPAGLGVMAVQSRLMGTLGFVPAGFTGQWRPWILGVSVGTGVALAVAGVLVASRRAGRTGRWRRCGTPAAAARVMTASRWIAGLLFLGGTLALVIVAPHGGAAGGQAIAMNVRDARGGGDGGLRARCVVPLVGRLIPTGGGATGELARANLWDARRRSASIAAPIIVLVGLVLGNVGAGTSFTASAVDELRRDTKADYVVEAHRSDRRRDRRGGRRRRRVHRDVDPGDGDHRPRRGRRDRRPSPRSSSTRRRTRPRTRPAARSPRCTAGPSRPGRAAASRRAGPSGYACPTPTWVRCRSSPRSGETMSGGASLLLPPGLVPPAQLAASPTRAFVSIEAGADPAAVRAALAAIGDVSDLDSWLTADAEARSSTNDKVLVMVLGLGGLYALIGVVNSVVIGAAARRREFAEARVTGLTRGQVTRSALLESFGVTVSGLVLGGLAAAAHLRRGADHDVGGHRVGDGWTCRGRSRSGWPP